MKRFRVLPALSVVLALAIVPVTGAKAVDDVDVGTIVLSVSDSTTAQVFHIVDQLSEWDQYAHKAYGRWARKALTLDQEDTRLLQEHARLRRDRGWGKGFEQAFLVDDSIEAAAAKAVATSLLSPDEAATERNVLSHFAPKVSGLVEQQRKHIAAFRTRLVADRGRLRPLVQRLSHFAEARNQIRVPVFLVGNPEDNAGGGAANGGRIVVEVPSPDPMGFLLHEALHVVLASHADAIRAAAESAGLSGQALNEGIAYAFAPGLSAESGQGDILAEGLSRFLIRGTAASDAYVQSYMIAAVIRPLLRESLDQGESIRTFLPRAVDKWRTVSPR